MTARRLAVLVFVLASVCPAAAETLPGPIPAEVVSVYDGDTMTVRARVWLGQYVETKVRLRGLDTPEIDGKCERERMLAQAAKLALNKLAGIRVLLTNIGPDKYASRVDATVTTPDGRDLAGLLLAAGHGRPYAGGRREGWC